MTLHRSALHPLLAASGATLQQRFGWELPRAYSGPAAEFRAATQSAAVHDLSYLGRLKAAGKDALDLLNRLSTNQVLKLAPGQGAPTILTTDRGRILDLVAVINTGPDSIGVLLLTSPGMQQPVIQWLDKYTIMEDLTVTDLTQETTLLAVLGPQARSALERVCGVSLAGLAPFHSVMGRAAGQPLRVIHRPLGELPSYDLLMSPQTAPQVWSDLVGLDAGIMPAGLAAYEALRVQQGVPAYGQELGEDYNPLEAGLIGAISFTKGCYIGQEVIARLDTYKKVQKRLAMLRFSPDAEVSPGATLQQGGQEVGQVTSVARVPGTEELMGLGYLRGSPAPGTRLEVVVDGAAQGRAEVAKLPLLFGPGEG